MSRWGLELHLHSAGRAAKALYSIFESGRWADIKNTNTRRVPNTARRMSIMLSYTSFET